MARKTMAERYAAQRSRKDHRRRALPRLSDGGSTAVADRDLLYDHDDGLGFGVAGESATFTAGGAAVASAAAGRTTGPTMPRRASGSARGTILPGSMPRVNYAYVKRDLRRIAITAVGMLVLLIVLNVVLQSIVH